MSILFALNFSMSLSEQYDKIISLKQGLEMSSKISVFAEHYSNDLYTLLHLLPQWTAKHTKASLLELLRIKQTDLALQSQIPQYQQTLCSGKIVPPKSVLEWKKKEEIASINYLPMILQSAFSPSDYYFRKPFGSKATHKELINAVVIDPNKIPQSFLDVFQIDAADVATQNVKELFARAQALEYYKEKSEKTRRVVNIDGKIVIFRTLELLLDDEKPYTQWSKRRHDTKKYMNAFPTLYGALRSQYHTIDSEFVKVEKYDTIKQSIVELMQQIKVEIKDMSLHRQIDQIILEIGQASSFPIMASKVYGLFELNFHNKSIAAKQLEGIHNKLSHEQSHLLHAVTEMSLQNKALEKYLYIQESSIAMFHTQVLKNVATRDVGQMLFAFDTYVRDIKNVQKAEPFLSFDRDIHDIFSWTQKNPFKLLLKAELLVFFQSLLLKFHQLEHKVKMGTTKPDDFVFDTTIFTKYPELYSTFFKTIDDHLHELRNISIPWTSLQEKNNCCQQLQQFRELPERKEIFTTLKQL